MEEKGMDECEHLKDIVWLSDIAFFTYLPSHNNKLNLKLQGRNKLIHNIWCHITALNTVKSFSKQIFRQDFIHFHGKTIAVREDKFNSYEKSVKRLHDEFEQRFLSYPTGPGHL